VAPVPTGCGSHSLFVPQLVTAELATNRSQSKEPISDESDASSWRGLQRDSFVPARPMICCWLEPRKRGWLTSHRALPNAEEEFFELSKILRPKLSAPFLRFDRAHLYYCNAACVADTAQPPVPPEVVQVWLRSVEK